MYSGYRTQKELFWSTVVGIAFAIALVLNGIGELPPMENPQKLGGTADTTIKGNREWPALVANDGRRYECHLRLCSISANPEWRQKFGAGLVAKDGTLISLAIDGHSVIGIDKFERARRNHYFFLATLALIELLLVLGWLVYRRERRPIDDLVLPSLGITQTFKTIDGTQY